jgi:hypothetical protein
MILDPQRTVSDTQVPIQSGFQTNVRTYSFILDTTAAIPSLEEYRQMFLDAGRDPEWVERYIDGLSKSSLYDGQTS